MVYLGIGPEQDPSNDPYYRAEQIEKVKLDEKRPPTHPFEPPDQKEKKWALATFIFLLFQNFLHFLETSVARKRARTQAIRENLLLFHAALEIMQQEDKSQDTSFLRRFAQLWQTILEHTLQLRHDIALEGKFKKLINSIENYPENEEHTLGYYLDEYADIRWLPFPYMEWIQNLHHQHVMDPLSSPLAQWTHQIKELLNLLNTE